MKIAIMGSGGVGGYFGGCLAAAGCDVQFVARGQHLEAMRSHGLRIHGPDGDLRVADLRATDDPGSIYPVDIVLFTVKLYDVETAAEAIRPLLGTDTAVVPFLNGVEAVEALGRAVGPGHVMGGVTYISSVVEEPGVIRRIGTLARLVFGEIDGGASQRAASFKAVCDGAKIDAVLSENIELDIWRKLVVLAAIAGVTSVTRLSLGPICGDPETAAMMRAAINETAAVARARGVQLPEDAEEAAWTTVSGLPGDMRSSMLDDLDRGRRLELPWLSGAVVRLGRELDIPTPTHAAIADALTPFIDGGGG